MKTIALILFLILSKACYCQDTVKVAMLYSDTSLHEIEMVDNDGFEYTELGYDYNSYWKTGYLVVRKEMLDIYDYLDADKIPIPKTEVIWSVKIAK